MKDEPLARMRFPWSAAPPPVRMKLARHLVPRQGEAYPPAATTAAPVPEASRPAGIRTPPARTPELERVA